MQPQLHCSPFDTTVAAFCTLLCCTEHCALDYTWCIGLHWCIGVHLVVHWTKCTWCIELSAPAPHRLQSWGRQAGRVSSCLKPTLTNSQKPSAKRLFKYLWRFYCKHFGLILLLIWSSDSQKPSTDKLYMYRKIWLLLTPSQHENMTKLRQKENFVKKKGKMTRSDHNQAFEQKVENGYEH